MFDAALARLDVKAALFALAAFSTLLYVANSNIIPLWMAVCGGLVAAPFSYAILRRYENK